MDHHTFVCGSSKSKQQNAYYIYHNDRFSGTLHEAGITETQIAPEDYRRLGNEYSICVSEIVDRSKYRLAKESEIDPHHVWDEIKIIMRKLPYSE